MEYKMEELVPIVGSLAEKYTAFESTSLTYEKAEQLMGAVLYCIREAEPAADRHAVKASLLPALQAYETGVKLVEEKTKRALKLYNDILPGFIDYQNHCLHDTFAKGLPEFFKWYDVKFEPQNTILTLDYPVLRDISSYTGIDKIYEFITCIRLEQIFLKQFPESFVKNCLSEYHGSCQDGVDNVCEIVLGRLAAHGLSDKPFSKQDWEETDFARIRKAFLEKSTDAVTEHLKHMIKEFLERRYADGSELFAYLAGSVDGIVIRLETAAKNRAPGPDNFPEINYNI